MVYLLQFVLEVVSRGFIVGEFNYLRTSLWKVFDFVIMLAAVSYLLLNWKVLRVMRTLRFVLYCHFTARFTCVEDVQVKKRIFVVGLLITLTIVRFVLAQLSGLHTRTQ